MHKHHSFIGELSEREQRMLAFDMFPAEPGMKGVESDVDHVNHEADIDRSKDWLKSTPGAIPMMDTFAGRTDLTIDDLSSYITQRKLNSEQTPLTEFENQIFSDYQTINPDPNTPPDVTDKAQQTRFDAEKRMNDTVTFINDRNAAMEENREKRGAFMEQNELAPVTGMVMDTAKATLSTVSEGFSNASGQEKIVMLAGAAAAVLMIRYAYMKMKEAKKGAFLVPTLGVIGGGLLTAMALESMNKAVEKTRGTPIVSWKNGIPEVPLGGLLMTEADLEKERKDGMLGKAMAELHGQNIDGEFLNQIGIDGNSRKFAIGIDNVADMSVLEFGALYDAYKGGKKIPDDSPLYPQKGADGDLLSATERFAMVEDIGRTMGLINEKGEFVQPAQPERARMDMLQMMINWDVYAAEKKAQEEEDKKKKD